MSVFFPPNCTFDVLKYKSKAVLLWGKEVPEFSKLQRTPASTRVKHTVMLELTLEGCVKNGFEISETLSMCCNGAWWAAAPSPLPTSTLTLCLWILQSASTALAATQFLHQWEHEKELRIMKNGTIASMPVLERQQGSQEEQTECLAGTCVLSSLMLGMLTCHRKLSASTAQLL